MHNHSRRSVTDAGLFRVQGRKNVLYNGGISAFSQGAERRQLNCFVTTQGSMNEGVLAGWIWILCQRLCRGHVQLCLGLIVPFEIVVCTNAVASVRYESQSAFNAHFREIFL